MIVKNCPALAGENGCVSPNTNIVECQKDKDCIIKKIAKEIPEVREFLVVEK